MTAKAPYGSISFMGKITPVSKKTKSGKEITLRNPNVKDASVLLEFGRMSHAEIDCMVTLPDEFIQNIVAMEWGLY